MFVLLRMYSLGDTHWQPGRRSEITRQSGPFYHPKKTFSSRRGYWLISPCRGNLEQRFRVLREIINLINQPPLSPVNIGSIDHVVGGFDRIECSTLKVQGRVDGTDGRSTIDHSRSAVQFNVVNRAAEISPEVLRALRIVFLLIIPGKLCPGFQAIPTRPKSGKIKGERSGRSLERWNDRGGRGQHRNSVYQTGGLGRSRGEQWNGGIRGGRR